MKHIKKLFVVSTLLLLVSITVPAFAHNHKLGGGTVTTNSDMPEYEMF
jgi:hypothetical protein